MENKLKKISNNVRLKVLEIVAEKKVGHIGGTFSCVDLLVTLYYGGILNINNTCMYCGPNTFTHLNVCYTNCN